MKKQYGVLLFLAIVVALLAGVPVAAPIPVTSVEGADAPAQGGQGRDTAAKAPPRAVAKAWTPPRTVEGQPDLQGVWANNSATPLQRPKQVAEREFFTDEELAEVKKAAAEIVENDGDAVFGDSLLEHALNKVKNPVSYDPATGNYNHFWLVERDFDNRTSLITDPKNGRLPPLTPEAEKRQTDRAERRKLRPADGPEYRSLGERCISFGVPRLGAGYNSYYQIFQTPQYVAIAMETIHDTRIIPLDGRPHLDKSVRQLHGDSRGRWEGNTLVVETTNFSSMTNFMGASENLHVLERFSRVAPDTLNYEVTVTDPTTWTRPWTVLIRLKASSDAIYEFACHEGNIGMFGILSGHRAQEKAEEAASQEPR